MYKQHQINYSILQFNNQKMSTYNDQIISMYKQYKMLIYLQFIQHNNNNNNNTYHTYLR